MKRRTFALLASTSLAGLSGLTPGLANAQAAQDPSLLTTTLTPMGGERAGNADGSIPAWTGGYTTLPAGFQPGNYIGELFPDEKPILVIDSSNMATHAARLNEGTMTMMTKYGFSIKVYPTHRTSAAPQDVYDAIAANVGRTKIDPGGARLGFTGAIGGIPFPIPDLSDPISAGAQIIWNHQCSWQGKANTSQIAAWVVSQGQIVLASDGFYHIDHPYYSAKSIDTYNGIILRQVSVLTGPPAEIGGGLDVWIFSDPYKNTQEAWQLLNGQGRVRRAPQVSFDTPSSQANGIINYDEYHGFVGSQEKYDWKCLGKQEMYVPYNNNALAGVTAQEALQPHFVDPDLVRYELHRCWVVEATLHPGERNVLARRRYYVDEDTFIIALGDMWDANGALVKTSVIYNETRPDLPGTIPANQRENNLLTDDYILSFGRWNQKANAKLTFTDSFPEAVFDPQSMAANAQY